MTTTNTTFNGFSPSYIQKMLADQLATGQLGGASKRGNAAQATSPFSKMLSDESASGTPMTASNAGSLLKQLVHNFQTSGVQSQGDSFDPNTIGA